MKQFEINDRVEAYVGETGGNLVIGKVIDIQENGGDLGKPTLTVRSEDDGEHCWAYAHNTDHVDKPKLAKLMSEPSSFAEPGRPLVGPMPKVEAPVFVAPFRANGDEIEDANGVRVLSVSANETNQAQDDEFAAYVAETLNARALGEAA